MHRWLSQPSFQEGVEDAELREVSETLPTKEHNFPAGHKFPGWLDTAVWASVVTVPSFGLFLHLRCPSMDATIRGTSYMTTSREV